MVDSKENDKFDLGVKGLSQALIEMGQFVFLSRMTSRTCSRVSVTSAIVLSV